MLLLLSHNCVLLVEICLVSPLHLVTIQKPGQDVLLNIEAPHPHPFYYPHKYKGKCRSDFQMLIVASCQAVASMWQFVKGHPSLAILLINLRAVVATSEGQVSSRARSQPHSMSRCVKRQALVTEEGDKSENECNSPSCPQNWVGGGG